MDFEYKGFESHGGQDGSAHYSSGYSGESWKTRRERESNNKLEALRQKYSKEFPPLSLHVNSVSIEGYIQELKEADLKSIAAWKEYHTGRVQWLQEELTHQYNQRLDRAKNIEERSKLSDWYFAEKNNLFKEQEEVWKYWTKRQDEILTAYSEKLRKDFAGRASQGNKGSTGQEKGGQNHGGQSNQDSKQPGGGSSQESGTFSEKPKRPEAGTEKKSAEQVALQELGITLVEYQLITNATSRFPETLLISLAEKIFGVSDGKNKSEVRKAFQQCARKWHPDRNEGTKKAVNEIKFQIVNAFYNNKYKPNFR